MRSVVLILGISGYMLCDVKVVSLGRLTGAVAFGCWLSGPRFCGAVDESFGYVWL